MSDSKPNESRIREMNEKFAKLAKEGWRLYLDGKEIDPPTVEDLLAAMGEPPETNRLYDLEWSKDPDSGV